MRGWYHLWLHGLRRRWPKLAALFLIFSVEWNFKKPNHAHFAITLPFCLAGIYLCWRELDFETMNHLCSGVMISFLPKIPRSEGERIHLFIFNLVRKEELSMEQPA